MYYPKELEKKLEKALWNRKEGKSFRTRKRRDRWISY